METTKVTKTTKINTAAKARAPKAAKVPEKVAAAREAFADAFTAKNTAGQKTRLCVDACKAGGIHARDIFGSAARYRELVLGWLYVAALGERAELCYLSGKKAVTEAGGDYDGVRQIKKNAASYVRDIARAICKATGEAMPEKSDRAGGATEKPDDVETAVDGASLLRQLRALVGTVQGAIKAAQEAEFDIEGFELAAFLRAADKLISTIPAAPTKK